MRILITCGPGSEPIDQVRYLSNFSTGELGGGLAAACYQEGWEVLCLRSRLAIFPMDPMAAKVIPFSTNTDLMEELEKISQEEPIDAVFHAAALCDYQVEKIISSEGTIMKSGKIPTQGGVLTMTLQPTVKVIASLRSWFPSSLLVGWKYEVDGTAEEAGAKAKAQIGRYQLDASVANGPAVGSGFEFLSQEKASEHLASKEEFASFLIRWVKLKRNF